MLRWKKRIRKMSYTLIDMCCILGGFLCAEFIFDFLMDKMLILSGFERIAFIMLFILFYVMMSLILNVYEDTIENFGGLSIIIISKMFLTLCMTEIFVGSLLFFMKVPMSRSFLMLFTALLILAIGLNRIVLKQFTAAGNGGESGRHIVVVGCSERGYRYIEEIRRHDYLNFQLIGYVNIKEKGYYEGLNYLGDLKELQSIVIDYVIDEVVVARSLTYDERLRKILSICEQMGITVTMLLETQNRESRAQVAMVGDLPVLKFHTVSLNESQIFMKRILDLIGSSIGMIIFGIAFLIIGPLIKLETPGPIIFKQDRVGRNGRIFKVWKFRSMGINAERKRSS